jgi:hypothetical protein
MYYWVHSGMQQGGVSCNGSYNVQFKSIWAIAKEKALVQISKPRYEKNID